MEIIRRTKIVDLLKREDFGAMVNVKGWVRTRRGSKQVSFIALNDGSIIHNVQVVVDLANFDENLLKDITTGACLSVNGELVQSVGSGQKVEIQAREIEVLGKTAILLQSLTVLSECRLSDILGWIEKIDVRRSLRFSLVCCPRLHLRGP